MLTLEEIKNKFDQGIDTKEGISLLNEYINQNPNDDEALTLRGLKQWSLGNRSEAINDYLAALKINPESKSKMAIKTAYEILNYYNKDLYNP
ncbi:MAG: hypothetical protein NC328_04985 [Muribaculum sp.]|nr:hypothetical protein [Muribaculum sp.]